VNHDPFLSLSLSLTLSIPLFTFLPPLSPRKTSGFLRTRRRQTVFCARELVDCALSLPLAPRLPLACRWSAEEVCTENLRYICSGRRFTLRPRARDNIDNIAARGNHECDGDGAWIRPLILGSSALNDDEDERPRSLAIANKRSGIGSRDNAIRWILRG
jgi:hypothetical protein